MPFTLSEFSQKLRNLRENFADTIEHVSDFTGIEPNRLNNLELGTISPTGDEILILSDYFKKDFIYFVEDESKDVDSNLNIIFRENGGEISPADRHSIAEFIYLCTSAAFLEEILGRRRNHTPFGYKKKGSFYKNHGIECAAALRNYLDIPANGIVNNIFDCIKGIGIRVFRRKLENSSISGLFINHPVAGLCILVNFSEGLLRQRFSAAHELAHALLDQTPTSFSLSRDWNSADLVEIRANSFAQNFLMPVGILQRFKGDEWTVERVREWATRLMVSAPALLSSLYAAKIISSERRVELREQNIRVVEPEDPELAGNLNPKQRAQKSDLLERGLSSDYVSLAFDAYNEELISRGKLSELLLVNESDLFDISVLFGRSLKNA